MPYVVEMEWSNDLVIRLIKEYKNKRELWDTTYETYRLSSSKYEAWQELASMFDCEIIDVKRKMNSLLASHRRERAKHAQGFRSTWYAFPYMKFLASRYSSSVKEDEDVNDNEDVEVPEDNAPDSDSDNSIQNVVHAIKVETVEKKKTRPIMRERLTRTKQKHRAMMPSSSTSASASKSEDSRIIDALRALQKPEKKRDECDIFGEYIANALRKHDQRTRAMIKHAMNNILFESEMKKYNVTTTYQHVDINLTEDTNPLIIPDQTGEPMPMEETMISEANENLRGQKLETIDNSYAN